MFSSRNLEITALTENSLFLKPYGRVFALRIQATIGQTSFQEEYKYLPGP